MLTAPEKEDGAEGRTCAHVGPIGSYSAYSFEGLAQPSLVKQQNGEAFSSHPQLPRAVEPAMRVRAGEPAPRLGTTPGAVGWTWDICCRSRGPWELSGNHGHQGAQLGPDKGRSAKIKALPLTGSTKQTRNIAQRSEESEDTNSVPSRDTCGPFLNAQRLQRQQRGEQLSKNLSTK